MHKSIIYRNIHIYRFVMNLLYSGRYKNRFSDVIMLVKTDDKSVLELCFGDIFIAKYCKQNNILWTGFDINNYFVSRTQKQGYNASVTDLTTLETLPKADVCIMIGSLYHFSDNIEDCLQKMLVASSKIIISEPIENVSSQKGWIGKIAGVLTNAGKGKESFRYDKKSIVEMLNFYKEKLKFNYRIHSIKRDILIEIIHERN